MRKAFCTGMMTIGWKFLEGEVCISITKLVLTRVSLSNVELQISPQNQLASC